ncbi:unnamed protein product, partial [Onchocerca flexuosa]|uniref:Membrane protein (Partial) n=1 Tax=Onchocerca flexuosa TaxID=387005 RepID=A0A183HLM0_9BILA
MEDDNDCSKDERCRMTLLASSSSSSSTSFYVPVTTLNMQSTRTFRKPYVQYHDGNDNRNDNNGDNGNIENAKVKQNTTECVFGSTYHYLQIDRNSINILLKVAAAFVLLCIAGCLVLQHLRINRLDYRIRRIELNSAHS